MISIEKIKKITAEEIRNMKSDEATEILKQARVRYNDRVKSFDKMGRYFFSYAKSEMDDFYKESGKPVEEKMSLAAKKKEITRLVNFFNAKTSTVKGSREVIKEQDIRLFGENEKGNPLHRMTSVERKAFWELYDEYLNQNKADYIYYEKVMQYLGEFKINTESKDDKYVELNIDILNTIKKALKENKDITEVDLSDVKKENRPVYRKRKRFRRQD